MRLLILAALCSLFGCSTSSGIRADAEEKFAASRSKWIPQLIYQQDICDEAKTRVLSDVEKYTLEHAKCVQFGHTIARLDEKLKACKSSDKTCIKETTNNFISSEKAAMSALFSFGDKEASARLSESSPEPLPKHPELGGLVKFTETMMNSHNAYIISELNKEYSEINKQLSEDLDSHNRAVGAWSNGLREVGTSMQRSSGGSCYTVGNTVQCN